MSEQRPPGRITLDVLQILPFSAQLPEISGHFVPLRVLALHSVPGFHVPES